MDLILAAGECDVDGEIICAPEVVNDLFEYTTPLDFFGFEWSIFGFDITRTVFLTFLAVIMVAAFYWFGLRKRSVQPGKFQLVTESIVGFVRDDIAIGIIGPEGVKYTAYLLSIFTFVLIANLFEIVPLINFPLSSRMWVVPAILAIITWFVYVFLGFRKNGIRYLIDIVWPRSVPVALRPLVGLIEFVSIFFLRPVTLAVRLFANLVAGHLMLVLLLGSGYIFLSSVGDIGAKSLIGIAWFAIGLGIFVFEMVVIILQAYIFTLLSAVYIESSLHPAH